MGATSPSRSEGANGNDQRSSASQDPLTQQRTPLPVKQVFVLCLMSFSEPVSLLVIFPFVNQMIEELGITSDPKEIGYYSGYVEGIFSVTQFFTIYFWGSLSDRIGRRPVLISGLCGVVASTIMFGLSKSLPMMLVARALSGALNGNSAVIKSVMGEITDETNQGAAFAYLPLCWSMGALIAPGLGGFLSHPAERYPSIFGYDLFRQYPYLLPCLAGSTFSTVGLIAGILFLKESLPKDRHSDSTSEERQPLLASESQVRPLSYSTPTSRPIPNPQTHSPDVREPVSDDTENRVPSGKEIMQIPYIRKVVISYGVVAFAAIAINSVMVLWLYTPVKSGGMGFSTAEIGTTLSTAGIFGAVIAAIVFPRLERKIGALYLYRYTMITQVFYVLVFPLGRAFALVWGKKGAYLGASIMLFVRCIVGMAFVSNQLLVTRSAPSKRSRGTINGLAQMFASASRAVGPATATSLFAFSVKSNILGGNLVWFVLSVIALLGAIFAHQIPSSRPQDNESQTCS